MKVGVVGATGMVGSTVLEILAERRFPCEELHVFASPASAGKTVTFQGAPLVIEDAAVRSVASLDLVFFAAGSAVSKALVPEVLANGGRVIDKSSAYREDPGVPLIVPEVNGHLVAEGARQVSTPNCVAIPLALVLAPLHKKFQVTHVALSTYQAASGAGMRLLSELRSQREQLVRGEEPASLAYPHVLEGNVVPGGWTMMGEETEEEAKIRSETRKVLGLPDLPLSCTTVRVPVEVGHSASVWVECGSDATEAEFRQCIAEAPGITVTDAPELQSYPMPRDAAGTDTVLVGRIRKDETRNRGWQLFWSSDNLRRGAATNAVIIAELMRDAVRA